MYDSDTLTTFAYAFLALAAATAALSVYAVVDAFRGARSTSTPVVTVTGASGAELQRAA
jgi:hypothetical protein